ncbi:hypothetical protein K7J14_09750 [Treponema zuelzerae]|uniref:Uncharacterized protein n=1 Tax=Teretinema zuelzerae TaxID=156 RepID=A0AAE3EIB3_9SPIR|nr:hypothetical protein [Teretinema zuelzerae]MCD1654982.1 hypothetical protein [Teretinema zuelzerae]
MNKRQFEGEVSQIVRMLSEHAYLQYSPASQKEYSQKIAAAWVHFQELMLRATHVLLPEDLEAAEDFSLVRKGTAHEVYRLLSRAAGRHGRKGEQETEALFRTAEERLKLMR